MTDCKIISFTYMNVQKRLLKEISGSINVQMADHPKIEQEINAYLRAGYSIQSVTSNPNDGIVFVLVR